MEEEGSAEEYLCGNCPDDECGKTLYFLSKNMVIRCVGCGQEHKKENVNNIHPINRENEIIEMAKGYMASLNMPSKGTEFVKVNGLCNFQCKILSPLLTLYGMDKDGSPKLLTELGHPEIIDCGKLLGTRAFHISQGHIDIEGFGKDKSGSLEYLAGFLESVQECNDGVSNLVPLHADGDGHCLVHAVSRSLIGREMFWHGLRKNLQDHLKLRLEDYKRLFQDFHDEEDWVGLIEEADPYNSSEGFTGGLGNIHIFALCNTLKRPIMLIDKPKNMQNIGDYSGLFVPALIDPSECKEKSPICIAWSGAAHNHFVPLVPIEGLPLPRIPQWLIPNVWGIPQEMARSYLSYNEDGSINVGGGKQLKTSYLLKLVRAMEKLFLQHHGVSSKLVEDFYQFVYFPKNYLVQPNQMIAITKTSLGDNRLRKCLECKAVIEIPVLPQMLKPGGEFYEMVKQCHQIPKVNKKYTFQDYTVVCVYNKDLDMLHVETSKCEICGHSSTRQVYPDYAIQYKNGDATQTPTNTATECKCGFKHYWDTKEYDNLPKPARVVLDWKEQSYNFETFIFYGDSNPDLNTDPMREAQRLVSTQINDKDCDDLVDKVADCLREKIYGYENLLSSSESMTDFKKPLAETCDKVASGDLVASTSSKMRVAKSEILAACNKNVETISKTPPKCEDPSKISVKISTSDGQKDTFKLDPAVKFDDLQNLIHKSFSIPPARQVLKMGFPPKLVQPETGEVLLKNGDQIKVEIKPIGVTEPKQVEDDADSQNVFIRLNQLAEQFKQQSEFSNMWEFARVKPELFLPGGIFYKQFEVDIGLTHGSHCTFPLLPNKRFQYNKQEDRIELCLEPTGHFPIDNDIELNEERVESADVKAQKTEELKDAAAEVRRSGMDQSPDVISDVASSIIAPGFITVNSVPTELSEEEINKQRDEILKTIENLKGK